MKEEIIYATIALMFLIIATTVSLIIKNNVIIISVGFWMIMMYLEKIAFKDK